MSWPDGVRPRQLGGAVFGAPLPASFRRLEDEGESTYVLPLDLSVLDLDEEADANAAHLAEHRPRLRRPHAHCSRPSARLFRVQHDDGAAVGAPNGGNERLAGQLADLLCFLRADEQGEVSGGGAILEVAPAAFGEWNLDSAVRAVRVVPTVAVRALDLAAVERRLDVTEDLEGDR